MGSRERKSKEQRNRKEKKRRREECIFRVDRWSRNESFCLRAV
jgi:hypothetical protein